MNGRVDTSPKQLPNQKGWQLVLTIFFYKKMSDQPNHLHHQRQTECISIFQIHDHLKLFQVLTKEKINSIDRT